MGEAGAAAKFTAAGANWQNKARAHMRAGLLDAAPTHLDQVVRRDKRQDVVDAGHNLQCVAACVGALLAAAQLRAACSNELAAAGAHRWQRPRPAGAHTLRAKPSRKNRPTHHVDHPAHPAVCGKGVTQQHARV